MGDLAISLLVLPIEVHSSKNELLHEDFNNIDELGDSNNINELGNFSSINELGDFNSINELGDSLNECLQIKDDPESLELCDSSNIDEVQFCSDLKVDETKSNLRSVTESVMFPSHDASAHNLLDPLEENPDQLVDTNLAPTNSIPSPALLGPSELVSAMKGSREKQGTREKMTVSWASDVYDPTPTIVSHTVKNKKQQKQWSSNRKKGKNKEKSKKSLRGSHSSSSSKDSKQYRRLVGGSSMCYRSFDVRETSLHYDGHSTGFDVGSPDSCGGSFLRESLTKVHMSVAQAL